MARSGLFAWGSAVAALLVLSTGNTGPWAGGDSLTGSGQWRSAVAGPAVSGKWTVSLTRLGGSLEGTMELTGSTLLHRGTVSGSIDGEQVSFGLVNDGDVQITFVGRVAEGVVSGQWDCATVKDHGSWSGSLNGVGQAEP